ncbi:hypothetical protein K469DRAFT_319639 [Zopfia rhizophila CBS 207.26]|uniref:Secreted protein n=1 Tax=Zopfia rhizophila CBS 207.26 TaxID=1314779 RepID=A0A6A6EP94_9PEZI|nr:hypothetical protein K469DRAFT_319639 [Zopfia rhizophila CBS 207.26]
MLNTFTILFLRLSLFHSAHHAFAPRSTTRIAARNTTICHSTSTQTTISPDDTNSEGWMSLGTPRRSGSLRSNGLEPTTSYYRQTPFHPLSLPAAR